MVDFAGWEMPVQYRTGIVAEHLATRRSAGLFDVSHMGRFRVRGPGAEAALGRVLTNDPAALAPGRAHYTFIANERGGAEDDAYLYRLARTISSSSSTPRTVPTTSSGSRRVSKAPSASTTRARRSP